MKKKYKNRILLVDDSIKNLQVVMSILKEYNVIYAQGGEKALELLKNDTFDLILLDVIMPGLDGYAVCKEIKSNEKTKNIPVIFLTVKDEEKDILKGFDLGAIDYIVKPFHAQVLIRKVDIHLKLANTLKELALVNNNLNHLVDTQIEKIRQKDAIIMKQSNINAMASIIDLMLLQWKLPFSKLNLYLQSLNYSMVKLEDENINKVFQDCMSQMEVLGSIMSDFHKFFNNKRENKDVNLKVSLDSILIKLKTQIEALDIKINIEGSNLITLNIVDTEINHIFIKILECCLLDDDASFKEKVINIKLEEDSDSINVVFYYNNLSEKLENIKSMFGFFSDIHNKYFNLGFYLVKIFVEKNAGFFDIEKFENGIKYQIKFNKISDYDEI